MPEHPLRGHLIVPEIRLAGLLFQSNQLSALSFGVKDTSAIQLIASPALRTLL